MIKDNFSGIYNKFKLLLYSKMMTDFDNRKDESLSYFEVFCMEIIVALEKPTINKFASLANISAPNAAYRVNKLIHKGFVKKVQNEDDKREYYLYPTEKYMEVYGSMFDYIELVSKRIECRFDEEELKTFGRVLEIIDTELQLKDLETIESQLAKQQKIAATGNKDAKILVSVLEAYKEVLEQGKNARSVEFESKEEQQAAHDLFLLTTKPVLYVCNVDESSAKTGNEYSKQIEKIAAEEGAEAMVIAAKTEEDIASLDSYEDKQMFLEELGLEESGVNRLINKAYHLLNLQTFITAGEMEVKAWTFHKGWKAPQCAGVIHTDFEKGFIRAEVIKYEDYLKYGSEAAIREAGKLGIEGKEYVVQDGDIMHFRFNV